MAMFLIAFLAVTSVAATVRAEELNSGEPTRFHLRFGVGLVFTAETTDGENAPSSFGTAPGVLDCVQIGGWVNEDFALFFQADSLVMFDITEMDARLKLENKGSDDVTYGFMAGIGGGTHLLQRKVFVSGTLGIAASDVVIGNRVDSVAPGSLGLGFSATVGRNWWSANRLNLGFAGQFLFMVTRGEHSNAPLQHTAALGALLVASFG